jgi:hypothetical protein
MTTKHSKQEAAVPTDIFYSSADTNIQLQRGMVDACK